MKTQFEMYNLPKFIELETSKTTWGKTNAFWCYSCLQLLLVKFFGKFLNPFSSNETEYMFLSNDPLVTSSLIIRVQYLWQQSQKGNFSCIICVNFLFFPTSFQCPLKVVRWCPGHLPPPSPTATALCPWQNADSWT